MTYAAAMVDAATLERIGPEPSGEQLSAVLDGGIDLDKAWWVAQVVLGGSIEASEPLMTGVPIGAPDNFYGPAHLASPSEVSRVAARFGALTEQELVERVDVSVLSEQGAHPMVVWDREDPEELATWVGWAAHTLIDLYVRAAKNNQSIIAAIR